MSARIAAAPTLRTSRLLLRPWRDTDLEPFAAMNADVQVMQFMPGPLLRAESDAFVTRTREHFDRHGFGLWAVEVPGVSAFIGFVGLAVPRFSAPFMPTVEVGWRLAAAYWGHGFATEGAEAALAFGFEHVDLEEIVSFTVPLNSRSIAVMQRLDMTHDPAGDFEHPGVPKGHPLRAHVLYRLPRTRWMRRREAR